MASLGTLAANLKLDGASAMTSGLRGVGQAASGLSGLLSSIQGPLALLGISFGAFKSAQGIADSLKGVFDAGRELQTLSRTTGQTVRDLVVLRKAFGAAGLSAEEVPGSLRLMQRALGGVNEEGQPTATVFARLGLSIQQLKGETAIQQFQQIGTAIRKLPDQATQAAAAMQIFGRSGAEMLAVFADPEALNGAAKAAGGSAEIFQRSAAIFARVSNDLRALGGKLQGFFAGVADQVAPVLLPLLDKLKSIDLTGLGEQVGGIVRMAVAAFQDGSIGEIVGSSLKLGGMEFVNFMSGAIVGIGQALGAAASLLVDTLSEMFSHFPTFIGAFKDGLVGAVQSLGAALLTVMQKPIVAFQSGLQLAVEMMMEKLGSTPLLGKALGLQGFKASSYDDISAERERQGATLFGSSASDLAAKGAASLSQAAAGFKTTFAGVDLAGGLKSIMQEFQNGMKAGGGVYDAKAFGDVQDKLSGLIGQLQKATANVAAAPEARKAASSTYALGDLSKITEGDRLAKIGGFIGGGGGPALDFHKRTAAATEATAKGVQALVTGHLQTGRLGAPAVWA